MEDTPIIDVDTGCHDLSRCPCQGCDEDRAEMRNDGKGY